MEKIYTIKTTLDWKTAMKKRLADHGVSHYSFARRAVADNLCTLHTAECLLAAEGTVTGDRSPSFGAAISLAALAGYDLVLVPKREPKN